MLSVLMVDADAPTGGDGLAWATALNDLQPALTQAAALNADANPDNNIDSIWIAEGVYKPSALLESADARSASFSLVNGVALYGGFAGDETALDDRDWTAHVTTLSGDLGVVDENADNAYTVVYCSRSVTSGLDGMSITGGKANGSYNYDRPERRSGAGIYNVGTLTVADCRVFGNSSLDSGGGAYNYTPGTLTVTDCMVSDNSATKGGGVYSLGSGALTVANSLFSNNLASNQGGGIFGARTVTNCTLYHNTGRSQGGGIFGGETITNCTIFGNSSTTGGGIRCSSATTITNSTISGNWANDGGGGIDASGSPSMVTLNNTIVAGNASMDVFASSVAPSSSCNLIGNSLGITGLVHGVNGNLLGTTASPIDPVLSDWTQFDNGFWGCYLLPGSPALNAGSNSLALDPSGLPLAKDIAGNARIQGGKVDMGAVEGAMTGTPARTYVVTSLDNSIASDGVLTFLEAFDAANRNRPVGDAPAGSFTQQDVITFADGLDDTIPVEDGELVVMGDLSIEGPDAGHLAFQANGQNRVFLVWPNTDVTMDELTISGGSAYDGGGIFSLGTLTITNSVFSDNSATDRGGGICGYYGSGMLTVSRSTFSDNAAGRGGGICCCATLTVTDSLLSENSANYGGGIYSCGTLSVTNSTVSGNSAVNGGGGICTYSSKLTTTLNNTIVAGNTGTTSPDIYRYPGALSGSHNLIGDGSSQLELVNGVNGNIVGTTAAPIDAMLDANGVPRSGSPAINAGSNALAVDAQGNPLTTDKNGRQRILYGTVDIGAFETALPGDANQDYTVTDADAAVLGAHWLWRSGVSWDDGDFNTDGVVDDRDAAILAAHWVRGTEAAPVEETPSTPTGNGATEPISNAPISNAPSAWMSFVGPRRPSAAFIGPVRASGVLLQRNENAGLKLAAYDAALAEGFGDDASDDATSVLARRKLSQLLRMPLDPAEWLR